MIFSKKEITLEYTLEKCDSCKKEKKREFLENDILFSKQDSCSCGGTFYIEMIFGETMKQ